MTTLTTTYRDDSFAADLRYDDLREQRLEELPSALTVARIRERRVGRIAAGTAGIGGALVLAGAAINFAMSGDWDAFRTGALGEILLGTWGIMGVAYAAGRVAARLERGRPGIPERSRDRWADVERLHAPLVTGADRREADALEKASVALPLMAIAVLAPLTVHAVVYAGFLAAVGGSVAELRGFDAWMAMSLAIVGHAHLVLAFFGYRFASKLRAAPLAEVHEVGRKAAWNAFWWTVVASAVPGAILYLIPPILTFLTGLVFSPAMFLVMRKRVAAERMALEA
jgi:hypothetical protein